MLTAMIDWFAAAWWYLLLTGAYGAWAQWVSVPPRRKDHQEGR